MKAVKKILQAALFGYFLLVLYSTINIPSFFYKSSHQQYNYSKKLDVIKQLAESHKAFLLDDSVQSFSQEYQAKILNNKVILDSTIIGTEKDSKNYYVKADLGAGRHGRIFAKLVCDKKLYNAINEFNFHNALLIADIKQIDISDSLHYLFKDDKEILAETGPDILLSGACIDAVELAAF
jgi:hypothetical protein